MNFKIRTTGNDLPVVPFFNTYGEGSYNPFHPEYAPKSVGGTMFDMANPNSEGNCTWYAFGRRQEAVGDRFPLEKRRGNARDWVVDSNTPEVGAIVVFDDGNYGHVAFIESIEGDRVIVSESVYSERGNDVLFRIGRTVSQICSEWGMTIKGYIAPPEKCASYYDEAVSAPQNGLVGTYVKMEGTIKLYDDNFNPYTAPSESTKNVLVVDETEGWLKVRHQNFNPTDVWVKKTDLAIAPQDSNQTSRVGQILVVRDSFPRSSFHAYADQGCTVAYAPWTASKNPKFKIIEDHDPVFKCAQYGSTPMIGTDHVWIKWESGIGFDEE